MSVTTALALVLLAAAPLHAHSTAPLQGRAFDESGTVTVQAPIARQSRWRRPSGRPTKRNSTRRVVLLYDERLDFPGLAVLDATLGRSLASALSGSVEVYREAMDLSRFASDGYLQLLRDYLRNEVRGEKD